MHTLDRSFSKLVGFELHVGADTALAFAMAERRYGVSADPN